jgi:hypothetical protein
MPSRTYRHEAMWDDHCPNQGCPQRKRKKHNRQKKVACVGRHATRQARLAEWDHDMWGDRSSLNVHSYRSAPPFFTKRRPFQDLDSFGSNDKSKVSSIMLVTKGQAETCSIDLVELIDTHASKQVTDPSSL